MKMKEMDGRIAISGTIVMTHRDGSVTQQPFTGSVPLDQVEIEEEPQEDKDGDVCE